MQVGRQVVGELERAVDEGGFDGVLAEFLLCDMKLFMWMFDEKTCGSVRSSLSAPARLVTVGSEAAETMSFTVSEGRHLRRSLLSRQHQGGWRARLDDTLNICELPQASSSATKPKVLTGFSQKGTQPAARL